jgi:hypothetical protein
MRSLALLGVLLAACARGGSDPRPIPGRRVEIAHPAPLHEVHVSEPSLALGQGGEAHVAWLRDDPGGRHVWIARVEETAAEPVRVDPPELAVDSHQAPALAVAPDGAVHLAWSSRRPDGGSDLRLSTSRDGGRSFAPPLRVSEDSRATRGFEGIAVDATRAVLVAWIEIAGPEASTLVARVPAGEARVASVARIDEKTCPCCRVAVATCPRGRVGVLFRDESAGDVRDMRLALAEDGAARFSPPGLVHDDGWSLAACPHRGGSLAFGASGRATVAWYTEGTSATPEIRLATADAGGRFGTPLALHDLAGSLPDRVALALRPDGRGLVAWESLTAVRSAIAARVVDAGRGALGPTTILSAAVKARAPAVAAAPDGDLVVAWLEESFPAARTVVQTVAIPPR